MFYDAMRFDILLTSKSYVFEGQPFSFPRRRLYQALSLPEVIRAMPVYHNIGIWLNAEARLARDVFVVGFNPSDPVFDINDIERQTAATLPRDLNSGLSSLLDRPADIDNTRRTENPDPITIHGEQRTRTRFRTIRASQYQRHRHSRHPRVWSRRRAAAVRSERPGTSPSYS
jgi:hypothetical protein